MSNLVSYHEDRKCHFVTVSYEKSYENLKCLSSGKLFLTLGRFLACPTVVALGVP